MSCCEARGFYSQGLEIGYQDLRADGCVFLRLENPGYSMGWKDPKNDYLGPSARLEK